MASQYINGLWFSIISPSHYVYRDFPGVSIEYCPRLVSIRTKIRAPLNPKPKKKPHGGKRIKTKNAKPKYRITRVVLREWILCDGNEQEVFHTLGEACAKLREVMRDYNSGVMDL